MDIILSQTLRTLNPFSRRNGPRVPSILQVIMLSMLANRRQDLPLGAADMLIDPMLPADFQWTRWERHTEVLTCAYQGAGLALRQQMENGDSRLSAIIEALA